MPFNRIEFFACIALKVFVNLCFQGFQCVCIIPELTFIIIKHSLQGFNLTIERIQLIFQFRVRGIHRKAAGQRIAAQSRCFFNENDAGALFRRAARCRNPGSAAADNDHIDSFFRVFTGRRTQMNFFECFHIRARGSQC